MRGLRALPPRPSWSTGAAGWTASRARLPPAVWELIFLLVILKIPIVYLCLVVYWAIRAEPKGEGGEGAAVFAPPSPEPPSRRSRRRGPPRPVRPHGGPARRYARTARAATAYGRR
jgi:hypothetical protein